MKLTKQYIKEDFYSKKMKKNVIGISKHSLNNKLLSLDKMV